MLLFKKYQKNKDLLFFKWLIKEKKQTINEGKNRNVYKNKTVY